MPRLSTVLCLFLLACGTVLADEGDAFAGIGRKWKHYESPNFELYSSQGESDSRDVLENMELLHAAFIDVFRIHERNPQPVTIYCFDRDEDFEGYLTKDPLRGRFTITGFCASYPDRTIIALAPSRNEEAANRIVYHEYVHYMFRVAECSPPPWFAEGFAEMLSTIEVARGSIYLGKPVSSLVSELHRGAMIPLEELFAVDQDSRFLNESGHAGTFYAESWLFMHYLHFGKDIPNDKLARFLDIAGSPGIQDRPEKLRTACVELLGTDYAGLQRELERYSTRGRFAGGKIPVPETPPRSSFKATAVDRSEITERLAEMALLRRGDPAARKALDAALLRDPANRRAHEVIGSAELRNGNLAEACAHWDRAVELGSNNAAVLRSLCAIEFRPYHRGSDLDFRLPPQEAARGRRLLMRSIDCAPEQSQAYEMLAWVEAFSEEPQIANVNLVQRRFQSLNGKARTALALALIRVHLGDNDGALKLLDAIGTLEPAPAVVAGAETIRARITNRANRNASLPGSG